MARAIRNAIRANGFATETPIFVVRQADSPESLECPIRANHPIHAVQKRNKRGYSRQNHPFTKLPFCKGFVSSQTLGVESMNSCVSVLHDLVKTD